MIADCIIWGNFASKDPSLHECPIPSFSCIEGWNGIGEGNIQGDPMFVAGPFGDYYLHPESPCIDAGSQSAQDAGLSDRTTLVKGTPDAGIVDMGFHYPIGTGDDPVVECFLKECILLPGDYTFYGGISLLGGFDLLIGARDNKIAVATYHKE